MLSQSLNCTLYTCRVHNLLEARVLEGFLHRPPSFQPTLPSAPPRAMSLPDVVSGLSRLLWCFWDSTARRWSLRRGPVLPEPPPLQSTGLQHLGDTALCLHGRGGWGHPSWGSLLQTPSVEAAEHAMSRLADQRAIEFQKQSNPKFKTNVKAYERLKLLLSPASLQPKTKPGARQWPITVRKTDQQEHTATVLVHSRAHNGAPLAGKKRVGLLYCCPSFSPKRASGTVTQAVC